MEELGDQMQSRHCKIVYGHHLLGERAFPAINGANILFSVVFTPPAPKHHGGHLSTLNDHCIAGAGLPIHIIGAVLGEPKRR
jgi:hypothetical protein